MKGLPNILWLEGEGMPFLLKDNNGLDSATNVDAMNKEINKVWRRLQDKASQKGCLGTNVVL